MKNRIGIYLSLTLISVTILSIVMSIYSRKSNDLLIVDYRIRDTGETYFILDDGREMKPMQILMELDSGIKFIETQYTCP